MASGRAFIDSIAEQLDLGARLAHRKMFGVYALSLGRTVVAFACADSLFIKPNDAVARLHPELPQRPPYPVAKDCPMADELLDDADACAACSSTAQRCCLRRSRRKQNGHPRGRP